jgi:hypothetical protein
MKTKTQISPVVPRSDGLKLTSGGATMKTSGSGAQARTTLTLDAVLELLPIFSFPNSTILVAHTTTSRWVVELWDTRNIYKSG